MSIENLLKQFGIDPNHTILDLGCGNGSLVESFRAQGFDAYGCDVANSDASDFVPDVATASYLLTIDTQPYKLPFNDSQFDFVVSQVVLEHVKDYESTFREIHRVLKPGGISLHIFPSRYVFVEPHVFVPLATIFRNKAWLYLWAALGVRNQFQIGNSAKEVTHLNYKYLHAHTNYLTNRQVIRHTHLFSEAKFKEDLFFVPDPTSKRKQSLKKRLITFIGGDKLLAWMYRTFSMRLLVIKK